MTPHQSYQRRAFTMIELAVSMSVMTVVMGGLATAMLLATRAVPDGGSSLDAVIQGYYTAEQVTGELYEARTFTVRSPTAVEFTVADRDSDSSPEMIRYEWSGTAGDPLTRKYNGETAVEVVADVYAFDLSYEYRTLSETTTEEATVESALTSLAWFADSWPGEPGAINPRAVSLTGWSTQCFEVTVPEGTSMLKFKSAEVNGTPFGDFTMAIHRSTGDGSYTPAQNPIGTPFTIFSMPFYGVQTAYFGDVTVTDVARTDYCLVLKGVGATAALIDFLYSRNAPPNGMAYRWSEDAGATWNPKDRNIDEQDLLFTVRGTFLTTGTVETTTNQYFLRSIGLTLCVGSDALSRVETSVQVLNAPEVAGL